MSNLTIDECKRIISEGRKQLTAADDRIRELESLVRDMYSMRKCFRPNDKWPWIEKRIAALGLEVDA